MKGQKSSWEPRAQRAQRQEREGGVYTSHHFVSANDWDNWSGNQDETYRRVEEGICWERVSPTLEYSVPGDMWYLCHPQD